MTAPKAAHTPGPWTLGRNGDHCAPNHAICSGPHVLAKVYGGGYPVGEGASPESSANARLIAAAPEMAETLEATDIAITNLLQIYGEHAIIDGARAKLKIQRDRIRALLARIDGETP